MRPAIQRTSNTKIVHKLDYTSVVCESSIVKLIDVVADLRNERYQLPSTGNWQLRKSARLIDSISRRFPIGGVVIWEQLGYKIVLSGMSRLNAFKLTFVDGDLFFNPRMGRWSPSRHGSIDGRYILDDIERERYLEFIDTQRDAEKLTNTVNEVVKNLHAYTFPLIKVSSNEMSCVEEIKRRLNPQT